MEKGMELVADDKFKDAPLFHINGETDRLPKVLKAVNWLNSMLEPNRVRKATDRVEAAARWILEILRGLLVVTALVAVAYQYDSPIGRLLFQIAGLALIVLIAVPLQKLSIAATLYGRSRSGKVNLAVAAANLSMPIFLLWLVFPYLEEFAKFVRVMIFQPS